jgi:hypothetical protein
MTLPVRELTAVDRARKYTIPVLKAMLHEHGTAIPKGALKEVLVAQVVELRLVE